jgi:signal transduction histidine kinase
MGMELGRHGRLVDTALAIGATAFVVVGAALTRPAGLLDHALLVAACAVLVAHTRAPRGVMVVTTLCVLGFLLRVGPSVFALIPALVAVYAVAAAGHRLTAVVGGAPFVGLSFVNRAVEDGILSVGWFVAAVVLGEVARARRAYLRQVELRAADAERRREEVASRRAAEERLRIARELHDSLTHSISVIKVQAGVAIHLARKHGQTVPDALSRSRTRVARRCGSCGRPSRCCADQTTAARRTRPGQARAAP